MTVLTLLLAAGVHAMDESPFQVSATAKPAFEAASVTPASPDLPNGIDYKFLPTRFVGSALTLRQLIEQAYGLEARELRGGPEWIRSDRFDVMATAGQEVPPERLRQMLQVLLAERFQLQLEGVSAQGTVYRLIAEKPHDLKPPMRPDAPTWVGFGYEILDDATRRNWLEGRNASMAALARGLAQGLAAPVTDATNLSGNYDFRIQFSYDTAFFGQNPDPNSPSLVRAVTTQLGLKVVAEKGTVTLYEVRRAMKPTPN